MNDEEIHKVVVDCSKVVSAEGRGHRRPWLLLLSAPKTTDVPKHKFSIQFDTQ